jgi:hypothetical protein
MIQLPVLCFPCTRHRSEHCFFLDQIAFLGQTAKQLKVGGRQSQERAEWRPINVGGKRNFT